MAFDASTRAWSWRRRVRFGGPVLVSAATLVAGCVFLFACSRADAQALPQSPSVLKFPTVPDRPKAQPVPRAPGEKSPMLLQATEVQ